MPKCSQAFPSSHHDARRKRYRTTFLGSLLLCGALLCGQAESYAQSNKTRPHSTAPSTSLASLLAKAKILLANRDYSQAISALEQAHKQKVNAESLYLLGHAYVLAKKYKQGAAVLLNVAKRFPKSTLRTKATLEAADAFAQAKQYDQASQLYDQNLKALMSGKRRAEIAQIYLRYAKRYAKPPKNQKTNSLWRHRKSAKFYKKALKLGLPTAQQRDVMLALGLAQSKGRQTWSALRTFREAIKKYPKGKHADLFVLSLAKELLKRYNKRKARNQLLDLIKDHPKSKSLPEAHLLLAQTYGLPYRTTSARLALGVEALETLSKRYPSHSLAIKAGFQIARSYRSNSRYNDAIAAYRIFLTKYAGRAASHKERYLARARYAIGRCFVQQKRYEQALQAYQDFLKAHPTDRSWQAAQRQIVTIRYRKAQDQYQQQRWDQARNLYMAFLQAYPLDSRSAFIMKRLGDIALKQKRYKQAIEAWKQLASKYPSTSQGYRAYLDIGQIYEQKLKSYKLALKAYRHVRNWRYRSQAQRAIRRLTKAQLTLTTPRVYTVKEGGSVRVKVRNVKELQVRLYRVDPATYFRKMRRFGGMDKLDIQLIRPDRSWTVKVPKYQAYHLSTIDIPIKSKKAMVSVIQVTGGKLEASTVSVVSDLHIITKASRSSLFVYALHGQTRRPVANARLLVSDGRRILFEAKTDAKGVYQGQSKKLKQTSKLKVLALHKGSIATNDLGLLGAVYSRGVSAAGVLYTDRPAYRPGDQIHIRGILREERGGRFVLPTKPYTFRILAPNGQVLVKQSLKPSEFGTIHTSFLSDNGAALGQYRLLASRKKGATFYGSFQLRRYRLPKYLVKIEMPRQVYMRNQRIKGKIIVRYGFGAPAANKLVQYRLGGVSKKSKSDAKGVVRFDLSTRELDLDRVYTMSVSLPGEQANARLKVWLRSTAFDLFASTLRKVYAAGESLQLKVSAKDPAGKKYAAKVDVRWYRFVEASPGRTSERAEGQKTITLNKQGKATLSLILRKGGRYVFRLKAKDAAGQPITASHRLFVSGDEDKQVLRLLSNRSTYRVGEKAKVKLLARRDGTVLLTYEANRVLYHRLIPRLKKGAHNIDVRFAQNLSPNFTLAVTMLSGQKLYTAKKEFEIRRQLQIKLSPKSENWAPGSTVEIVMNTTDQTGQPVSAELSVAVVDNKLLALYPDKTPDFESVFYRHRRQNRLVTRSSHTYNHTARTGRVSQALKDLALERNQAKEKSRLRLATPKNRRKRWRWNRRRSRRGWGGLNSRRRGFTQGATGAPVPPPPPAANAAPNMDKKTITREGKSAMLQGLRTRFASTAYWNPSLRTDKKGRVVLRFQLPQNITSWTVWVRGVAKPTLVGQVSTRIVTRKPFLTELSLPSTLSEGDSISPRAVVHNQTEKDVYARLVLSVVGLKQTRTLKVKVAAGQSQEVSFPAISTEGAGGKELQIRLQTSASGGSKMWRDALQRKLTVRLPGVKLQAGRSGIAGENVKLKLRFDSTGPYRNTKLALHLGPVSPRWLLELVEKLPALEFSLPGLNVYRAHQLLTGLDYLKGTKQHQSPRAKRMLEHLTQLSRAMWQSQRYDGGWDFVGRSSSTQFSSLMYSVLQQAHARWGVFAPKGSLNKARSYLKQSYQRTFNDDQKAVLLHALTLQSRRDRSELYTYANRLQRRRSTLGLAALAHLTLSLHWLQRQTLARSVVRQIETRLARHKNKGYVAPYGRAARALAIQALLTVQPNSTLLTREIQWLLSLRRGRLWPSLALTGQALRVLTSYYLKRNTSDVKLKVKVKINGKPWGKELSFVNSSPNASLERFGINANQAIELELTSQGFGQFRYSALLTGYSKKPAKTLRNRHYRITRNYRPAPKQVEGRKIVPGFWMLRQINKRWYHKVKQLPVGQYTQVSLNIVARPQRRRALKGSEDLIVEEALPGGTMVLPSTIYVQNGRFHLEDGRIRFFLSRQRYRGSWTIRYRLYGSYQGQYHVPATKVWPFSQPELLSLGKTRKLEILAADAKVKQAHKLTPNELFWIGKAYFDAKRYNKAWQHLSQLHKQYKLKRNYLIQVTRMLFQIALKRGTHASIVRHFEALKELAPTSLIPFKQIIRVGRAYTVQKEHERAYMVLRATTDARFLEELKVASTLENEGEFDEAMRFIGSLVWRYPNLRKVQEAQYAQAQSVFQRAGTLKKKPAQERKTLTYANRLFHEFVWMFPEHPSADAASYARANVMMAQKQKETAIRYLKVIAQRYAKSKDLASMHYLQAYALYQSQQYREALELLKGVSQRKYPNGRGGMELSKDRFLAMYLIAQIYHARNELDQALRFYTKVRKRFPDARAQYTHFKRQILTLPEITTLLPDAKVQLKLKHQNIAKLTIRSYYVDLMKLYLLKRNLNAVTRINLAGIKPTYAGKQTLGLAKFSTKTRTLPLPLKRRGSYLVVLKSGNKEVSGIVMRTAMVMEVEQDPISGRVTVSLLDQKTRNPIVGAIVRVGGSAERRFQSGKTDLRGIFTVENVRGKATVIAQKGDDFAFHRGKVYLRRSLSRRSFWQRRSRRLRFKQKVKALKNIFRGNAIRQRKSRDSLKRLYRSNSAGVEIQKAY